MPGGTTVKSMSKQASLTAGGAAWRFAPLVLIAGGLCLCWAMGWHRYRLAGLARRTPRHAAAPMSTPTTLVCGRWSSSVFYVAGDGALVSGRCHPDDLQPASCSAGCRAPFSPSSARPAARACCSWPRARAFGGFLRDRAGGLAAQIVERLREGCLRLSAGAAARALRSRSSWSTSRRRCATCGQRSSWRRRSIGILPGALAYSWLGKGWTACCSPPRRPAGDASIHDLVTPEITDRLRRPRPCRAARRHRKTPRRRRARPENAARGPIVWRSSALGRRLWGPLQAVGNGSS